MVELLRKPSLFIRIIKHNTSNSPKLVIDKIFHIQPEVFQTISLRSLFFYVIYIDLVEKYDEYY